MKRTLISLAIALGALVPAIALAQTPTTGTLNVYVQVLNQNTTTYFYQQYQNYQNYQPGAFTVSVSGQNPSLTNFPGSQSGTVVMLNPGSYNVTVTNSPGNFSPSYSVGCNGTISAGESETCVITMTPSYNYYQYPMPYSSYLYPYVQPLTCQTSAPTVGLGQPVSFNAVGGAGGTYNWATASRNYPNAGPTLTISFQDSGTQVVTVTNATQTASCTVTVTNMYYPPVSNVSPVLPVYPTTNPVTAPVTYYQQTYPKLPNTGFAPGSGAMGIAFAAVLLIAAGTALSPYARKTLASISR